MRGKVVLWRKLELARRDCPVIGFLFLLAQAGFSQNADFSPHGSRTAMPSPPLHFLEDETRGKPMLAGTMATNIPHRLLGTGRLSSSATEGKWSRWFELQSSVLTSRYRYADSGDGVITGNGGQHREAFKGRIKFDSKGKYGISGGVFSGGGITRGWSNSGWGNGRAQTNVYLKQLYLTAQPIRGLEAEYGGLYILHGESTEITSYDYHAYLVGQRISLQRPQNFFFDEISITYAYLGDFEQASLLKRFHRLRKSNYHQYLVSRKVGKRVVVSGDYTFESGVDTFRQAFKIRLPELRVVDSFHFENYQRSGRRGYGLGVYGEKSLTKQLKLGGGYAGIDRNYGRLNSDHFSIGKRLYATASVQLTPEFGAALFVTRALASDFALPVRTRLDVVFSYNLLSSLKRTAWF